MKFKLTILCLVALMATIPAPAAPSYPRVESRYPDIIDYDPIPRHQPHRFSQWYRYCWVVFFLR